MRRSRWVLLVTFTLVIVYVAATVVRFYSRKYYIFAADYLRWTMTARAAAPAGKPTEVFFFFTDHYEPDSNAARVRTWSERYRALASRHHDAEGRSVQHSWFYPGEQGSPEVFSALHDLVPAAPIREHDLCGTRRRPAEIVQAAAAPVLALQWRLRPDDLRGTACVHAVMEREAPVSRSRGW